MHFELRVLNALWSALVGVAKTHTAMATAAAITISAVTLVRVDILIA